MRVLHISDLHANETKDRGQVRIVRAFLKDLAELASEQPFDLVVFSGDLADHGTAEQLEMGWKLLIEPTLECVGLDTERLVMVPGNHDVNWDRINRFEEAGLAQLLGDEQSVNALLGNSEALASARGRLSDFDSLAADHLPWWDASLLARSRQIEIGNASVGVVALDSAWRSSKGDDGRKLLVCASALESALEDVASSDVKLVVAHHPPGWLMPFDESGFRALVEGHRALVLSGHEHVPEPSFEATRRGQAVYSRAGCLYESDKYANAYSVVDYDVSTGNVEVTMRSWWPDRREFDVATNFARGGRFTFEASSGAPASRAHPPYNEVRRALADAAEHAGVGVSGQPDSAGLLEAVLVAPRFLPLPYKDAIAAKRVDDEVYIGTVDPLERTAANQGLVVFGETGSGITSSLLWLLDAQYQHDRELLPVVVPFDPRFSRRGIEQALGRAAAISGWGAGTKALPPLHVAIDDVTPAGRGLKELLEYFADNTQHKFVLGAHEHHQGAIRSAVSKTNLEVEEVFLGPFGRGQLRNLIEKIAGPSSPELLQPIYHVVYTQDLPRTPFLLSTLVVVVSEASPSDLVSVNSSALLQKYVDVLLGRDETGDDEALAMDYRRREYLLGSFAAKLVRQKVRSVTRLEAEKYLVSWFEQLGWGTSFSPGRILDSLIRRRVLAQDPAGQVGFRQPALQHLFAAKWMLEDQAFCDEILAEPSRHSEPISHAAALSRNSRRFIEVSRDLLAATMIDCEALVARAHFDAVATDDGWARLAPTPASLEAQLKASAPPKVDESERDKRYDEIDERRDAYAGEPDDEISQEDQLYRAIDLATSVLRSSELVDDVELKAAALRVVISGWGVIAGFVASAELAAPLATLVDDNEEKLADEASQLGDIERVVRLMMLVGLLMEVEDQLGTLHLEGVVTQLLGDATLMSESATALLLTLLVFSAQGPGAAKQLRALWESQGTNPMVERIVMVWAHLGYEHETDKRAREPLERLLADIYLANEGTKDAGMRGRITENLRSLRLKRLSRSTRSGNELDILDTESVVEGTVVARD